MFFWFLYRLGYLLSNILPLKAAYWVAERFSDIQYSIAKKDRIAVQENLSKVLNKDVEDCRGLALNVVRNFGLYLVDFFRMARLEKKDIESRIKLEGYEKFEGAFKKNKGVIMLSCHIGNWEMGGVVMGILGHDISAVALTHQDKRINDFFIDQREKKGFKVIPIESATKRCVSVLLKKHLLALLADRDFTNSGMECDFFGVKTSIPKGPALLSLKTNSPIVPVFFIREGKYNYRFIFEEPMEVVNHDGLTQEEIMQEANKKIVSVMEKYIRLYPDQWLVFRRFWEKIEGLKIL
ncbi:MAG: lysophospholipid acyltransferase family protein [Candidatus Omnitrophota bacterium]